MTDDFTLDPTRTYRPKQPAVKARDTVVDSKPLLLASSIPRTTEEMVAQAQALTDLSLEALEHVVRHGDKDSDRIAAALALLDRGHGKPTQQVNIRTNEGSTIEGQFEEIKRITGRDIRSYSGSSPAAVPA